MAQERPGAVHHEHAHVPEYVEQRVGVPAEAEVDQVRATAFDPYSDRRRASNKLVSAVYLVFGLIETLLVIRLVLKVLGADPSAGFAQFIYGITDVFVSPFVGLFGVARAGNGSVFEPHTLVALVVYALLAWLVAKILWLIFGETRSAVTTSATSVDTRVH